MGATSDVGSSEVEDLKALITKSNEAHVYAHRRAKKYSSSSRLNISSRYFSLTSVVSSIS